MVIHHRGGQAGGDRRDWSEVCSSGRRADAAFESNASEIDLASVVYVFLRFEHPLFASGFSRTRTLRHTCVLLFAFWKGFILCLGSHSVRHAV